jgi:regulator of protease activity HflC (stomatin/prohibitin superfamily)
MARSIPSVGEYTPPVTPRSFVGRAFWGAVVVIALVTAYLGVYWVHTGYTGVITRYGAIIGVADPGMHFKIPYIDEVEEMETRIRGTHLELSVSSGDPMLLPIKATVNWIPNHGAMQQIFNDYGTLEQFENRMILPAFQAGIKDATAKYTVTALIKDRTALADTALALVRSKVPTDIVTIKDLYIVNVDFPKTFTEQILATQVAQQAAAEQKFKLEKQNYVAQETTQTAQAAADATRAQADADAHAVEVNGKAQADAIALKAKALATNPLLVEYEKVQRWGGAFPATFMGGDSGLNTLWQLPASNPPSTATRTSATQ